jgi:alkylhydroperoxidase family enzyme
MWAVVLLGLIALGSLVQTIFLLGMVRSALLVSRRVREVQEGYQAQLAPALEQLARVQEDVEELSLVIGRQQERVREFAAGASDRLEATRSAISPVSRVLAALAVVKALRRGYGFYRGLKRRRA